MKPKPNSLHQPKTVAFGTKTLGLSLTPQTSAVPLLMSQHKHKKKDRHCKKGHKKKEKNKKRKKAKAKSKPNSYYSDSY